MLLLIHYKPFYKYLFLCLANPVQDKARRIVYMLHHFFEAVEVFQYKQAKYFRLNLIYQTLFLFPFPIKDNLPDQ